MNKRLLILLIIVFLVIAGATAYYFFYTGGNQGDDGQDQGQDQADTSGDDISDGSFSGLSASIVSDQQAISPTLSLGGGELWYFNDQGKLLHNSSSGGAEETFELPQDLQASRILWPVSGNDFITEEIIEGKPIYKYYDSQEKEFMDLPANIVSLAWLSDGKHIVYLWRRGDGVLELKQSLANSSEFRTLRVLDKDYDRLYAASSGGYVILRQPTDIEANTADIYTFSDGTFRTLADRGLNLDFSIAPNANKVVFSRLDSTGRPELWLIDMTFNKYENLGIKSTAGKIVWDGFLDRFYVAIEDNSDSAGENLFYYNTGKRELEEIWKPDIEAPVKFEEIKLDSHTRTLFYINSLDGKLYRLGLPN